jgi:hypothetical protein
MHLADEHNIKQCDPPYSLYSSRESIFNFKFPCSTDVLGLPHRFIFIPIHSYWTEQHDDEIAQVKTFQFRLDSISLNMGAYGTMGLSSATQKASCCFSKVSIGSNRELLICEETCYLEKNKTFFCQTIVFLFTTTYGS